MNIKFLIRHEVLVEEIGIERFWVANVREYFDYSLSATLSAGLVVHVRPSLSSEKGSILPTTTVCWMKPSGQAIHVAHRLVFFFCEKLTIVVTTRVS